MKCKQCGGEPINESGRCEVCKSPICERRDCGNRATKTIYGMGYLASVCQQHYDEASAKDKEDAIRFRYAEGQMFSYYGRKSKIIKKYPKPTSDLIIEPFAGSATYALEYWEHDVVIVEMYEKIIRIWEYLKQASPQDVLSLPDVSPRENVSEKYKLLCEGERYLIGFCINRGSRFPKFTAGMMCNWNEDKKRIAKDLHKIKHWNVVYGDYHCVGNPKATWFIDPPYQSQKLYKHNDINYEELSNWCKFRKGQVIVCENQNANWLDFSPLTEFSGQYRRTQEVIWYKP